MRLPLGSISRSGSEATNYDRQDRLLVASIKGRFYVVYDSPHAAMHGPDDCSYTVYSYICTGCSGMV